MDGGDSQQIEHEVVISAVPLIADFLMPLIMQVASANPAVLFRYRPSFDVATVTGPGDREVGPSRTTIALRAGSLRSTDTVAARRLGEIGMGLYATEVYVRRHGMATDGASLAGHVIVNHDADRDHAPWERWITRHAPGIRIGLRSNDELVQRAAVRSGYCAAFMPLSSLLWNTHLRPVMLPRPEWAAPLWLVTPPPQALPPPVRQATETLGDLLSRCMRTTVPDDDDGDPTWTHAQRRD